MRQLALVIVLVFAGGCTGATPSAEDYARGFADGAAAARTEAPSPAVISSSPSVASPSLALESPSETPTASPSTSPEPIAPRSTQSPSPVPAQATPTATQPCAERPYTSDGVFFVCGKPFSTAATPTPAAAAGYVRFHGRVIDANTGSGVLGVCLVISSLDCGPDKPHSDALGYWAVDLTSMPYWDIRFQMNGYRSVTTRVYSLGRSDVLVPDIRIRPG